MEESESPKQQAVSVETAVKHIQMLIDGKKYNKAGELLKIQIQRNPNQKELVKLYSDFRRQYIKDKIQKLQQEADVYLRSGQEDKAQKIFREIYRLDPTRTELKDAFRKTRGEIAKDYNKRVFKTEMVGLFTQILIFIFIAGLCAIGLKLYDNNRHLKQSEQYIFSLNFDQARQELDKCSRFFCPRKNEVLQKLQVAVDNLIAKAYQQIESKNFNLAREYLDLALRGTKDQTKIKEAIAVYQQQEVLWNEELARQEQLLKAEQQRQEEQKILAEKAIAAKTEFEKNLNEAIRNDAEIEAGEIIEAAKAKGKNAEKLYLNSKFESAQKQWLLATNDCKKATLTAAAIIEKKKETLAFKIKCYDISEKGAKINAPAEANEIWLQAAAIFNDAETQFKERKFVQASQLWQQAADKYSEAIEFTKQTPSYTKALMFANKWKILKPGLTEENIRNFFGEPKYIQADSEKRVWYYGTAPEIFKNSQGSYEWSMPTNGYICFAAVSMRILVDRTNDYYQKQTSEEYRIHSRIISDLNSQIAEENRLYDSRIKITTVTHPRRGRYPGLRQQPNNDYYNETQKHTENIKGLNNALETEKQRHQAKLIKLKHDCDVKNYELANGLTPREPKYFAAEWQMPDVDNLKCFMLPESKIEKPAIKPGFKWQIPAKWRSLKLNISEGDIREVLGEPDNKREENGTLIYRYGELADYGIVKLEKCSDSIVRVKSWQEPLWVHVTLQLTEKANETNTDNTL
ncbi:MAG: hypothetical protein LLF92_10830 [Planctomycetaceae bacterium]|nr:hypothetical protein [Planctomycetaceae bacterium]